MQHRTDQNELKDLDIDEKAIEEIKLLKQNSNKVRDVTHCNLFSKLSTLDKTEF